MEVDGGVMCVACGKKMKNFCDMRRHLPKHGILSPFPCPLCESVLSTESHRYRHIKNVHKLTLSYGEIRNLPPHSYKL